MFKAGTRKRILFLLIAIYVLTSVLFTLPAYAASDVKTIYVTKYGSGSGTGDSWAN